MHHGDDQGTSSSKIFRVLQNVFSDKDAHLYAEAERSRIKLQNIYNTQKRLGRSRANHRKQLDERVAEGTAFLEDNFRRCVKIVKLELDEFVAFHESAKHSVGIEQAVAKLDSKEIIRKRSINLLLMLIFAAVGQRPQVYTTLQFPDKRELTDMQDQAGRIYIFEMRTTIEKTKAKLDFPDVLVDESGFKYFAFHQQVTRRIIVRRAQMDESGDSSKPCLCAPKVGTS